MDRVCAAHLSMACVWQALCYLLGNRWKLYLTIPFLRSPLSAPATRKYCINVIEHNLVRNRYRVASLRIELSHPFRRLKAHQTVLPNLSHQ